jgi:hypothetical protein
MGYHSAEERQQIVGEARGRVAQVDRELGRPVAVVLPPVESVNTRHRREIEVQEKQFALERARDALAQQEREAQRAQTATATTDQYIAEAIAEERRTLVPVIRQGVDELLAQEREAARSELQALRLKMAAADTKQARLESELSVAKTRISDLAAKAIDSARINERLAMLEGAIATLIGRDQTRTKLALSTDRLSVAELSEDCERLRNELAEATGRVIDLSSRLQ